MWEERKKRSEWFWRDGNKPRTSQRKHCHKKVKVSARLCLVFQPYFITIVADYIPDYLTIRNTQTHTHTVFVKAWSYSFRGLLPKRKSFTSIKPATTLHITHTRRLLERMQRQQKRSVEWFVRIATKEIALQKMWKISAIIAGRSIPSDDSHAFHIDRRAVPHCVKDRLRWPFSGHREHSLMPMGWKIGTVDSQHGYI